MIRTRDFLLFVICVVFLLSAITVTVLRSGQGESLKIFSEGILTFDEAEVYTASLPNDPDQRSARIAALQQEISQRGVVVSAPALPPAEETETEATTTDEVSEDIVTQVIQRRAGYTETPRSLYSGQNLSLRENAGMRDVYASSNASVSTTDPMASETVIARLPVRSAPLSSSTCLPSDVVGIALDGSIIRNDEHSVYGIFSGITLIGYALDGFPIYGQQTELSTDACGGVVIDGQYRYHLSPTREGVLGCFAGAPVSLY